MELSLTEFVLIILLSTGLLVVASAMISRRLRRKAEDRALAHTTICRLCLHAFQTDTHEKILHCPQCGALNER